MVDNVVLPFPTIGTRAKPGGRARRVPAADELVRKVRRMLKFNRMLMPGRQMKEWLSSRNITMMQVLSTIKQGQPISSPPAVNEDGDWTITIKRVAAGRRVQVTVAVKTDHFVIRNVV